MSIVWTVAMVAWAGAAAPEGELCDGPFCDVYDAVTDLHCLRCHAVVQVAEGGGLEGPDEAVREAAIADPWPAGLAMPGHHAAFDRDTLIERPERYRVFPSMSIEYDRPDGFPLGLDSNPLHGDPWDLRRPCTSCHDYWNATSVALPGLSFDTRVVDPGRMEHPPECEVVPDPDEPSRWTAAGSDPEDPCLGWDFWAAAPNGSRRAVPIDMSFAAFEWDGDAGGEWCVKDPADVCALMVENTLLAIRRIEALPDEAGEVSDRLAQHLHGDGRVGYAIRRMGMDEADWFDAVDRFHAHTSTALPPPVTELARMIEAFCPAPNTEGPRCGGHCGEAGSTCP